ncbi:MAG: FxsA family protein, partial [Oleibacter sp.]|nr:FxsA family protein [Thalassolituus sp.]
MTAVGSALGEILPLLLIFIVIPMIELVLLIKVGSTIGILPTLGLILLTAFIGVNLLRRQGMATLMRARQNMEQGKLPAQELAEGFLLALAGALLLTPGFVTDAIGFTLLVPSMRKRLT